LKKHKKNQKKYIVRKKLFTFDVRYGKEFSGLCNYMGMKSMLRFYVLFYKYLTENIYKFFSLAFNKYASEKSTWDYKAKTDIENWNTFASSYRMTEGINLFVKPVARNGIAITTPFYGSHIPKFK